jgi:DUF4097 and DUF4098 domain-containing protein YvlB
MKRITLICTSMAIVVTLSVLSGCIGDNLVTDDFDGLYGTNADTVLTVSNSNGRIEITRTDGDSVDLHVDISSIHGQESLDDLEIVVDETEGNIEISTEYASPQDRATANMRIEVPWHVHIAQISTSNGDIDVKMDMSEGDAQVSSSNGEVNVNVREGFTHNLTVSSSNGRVTVRIDPGEDLMLTASTSNGKVTFSGLDVDFTVNQPKSKTGTMGSGGPMLTASSSNGNVDVRAA